jgi:hypothetical protein
MMPEIAALSKTSPPFTSPCQPTKGEGSGYRPALGHDLLCQGDEEATVIPLHPQQERGVVGGLGESLSDLLD